MFFWWGGSSCGAYHDEGVVQNEHDGGEPKSPALVPEDHLAEIADIANLRVAQTEFPVVSSDAIVSQLWKCENSPANERSVQDQGGDDSGQNQTWHETQDGVGPGKRHDGQADVLGEEQSSSLPGLVPAVGRKDCAQLLLETYFLPAAGAILDSIASLELNLLADVEAGILVRLPLCVGVTAAKDAIFLHVVLVGGGGSGGVFMGGRCRLGAEA